MTNHSSCFSMRPGSNLHIGAITRRKRKTDGCIFPLFIKIKDNFSGLLPDPHPPRPDNLAALRLPADKEGKKKCLLRRSGKGEKTRIRGGTIFIV